MSAAEKILTELHITDVIDQSLRTHESILHACSTWVEAEVARMVPKSMSRFFNTGARRSATMARR